MQGQAYPLFVKGLILRHEMLEATTDYAFKCSELLYAGYANGILSGCQLTTTKDAIFLNRGTLMYNGIIYLVKDPVPIAYHPTDATCVLKVQFLEENRTENFLYYNMNFFLEESTTILPNQMELCRFKLQQGAILRHQYVDFEDRNTEYDTLNTIYTPYAAMQNSTLSLEMMSAFAQELLHISCEDTIDVTFCMQVLGAQSPLGAQAIATYLHIKLDLPIEKTITNAHLYQGLLQVLQNAKKGYISKTKKFQAPKRKILVD